MNNVSLHKGKLRLPKPYLSYSAVSTWLYSKEQFRKRYYENAPFHPTPEMIFGKKIATMLEHDHEDFSHVPRYPKSEQKLQVQLGDVLFYGFIDSFHPDELRIYEYKTGKTPWTKKRVAEHLQLDLYSAAVNSIYGDVTDECHLIWLPTERIENTNDGLKTHAEAYDIALTGEVKTFARHITPAERKAAIELLNAVAKEISEDYTNWCDRHS